MDEFLNVLKCQSLCSHPEASRRPDRTHAPPRALPAPHPPAPSTPSQKGTSAEEQEALRAHASVRGGRPLLWDATLAEGAAEAAAAIVETPGSCAVHSVASWDEDTSQPNGRNTFAIFGAECDWQSVVESWSAEAIDERHLENAAHRLQTQGVSVARVGCASQSSEDGFCHAFVCQYAPRQNAPANDRLRDVLLGPDVACPATCGGVLPCRNTEA